MMILRQTWTTQAATASTGQGGGLMVGILACFLVQSSTVI